MMPRSAQNNPLEYIDLLKRFECVLTPDFSLHLDMPLPMQQWSVYRSRALGHLWQEHGLNVIPTLQYSSERSYPFCFEGLPSGGTIATSTVGVKNDKQARKTWSEGMKAALDVVQPKTLLVFGGCFSDFDFGQIKVIELKANTAFRSK